MAANRKEEAPAACEMLGALLGSASRAGSVDELRGFEGTGTARYFQGWTTFLPEEFPFERRSRRPPHNAVNACLSFGAVMLYHEMAALTQAHGLDAGLGLMHVTENGRWSLALDLMEPFRPVVSEALALDCLGHGILQKKHFEPAEGGIHLTADGRKKFILQYERRMERQFFCDMLGHRTTLRQQLEHQAVMLKSGLADESRFGPLLMN